MVLPLILNDYVCQAAGHVMKLISQGHVHTRLQYGSRYKVLLTKEENII